MPFYNDLGPQSDNPSRQYSLVFPQWYIGAFTTAEQKKEIKAQKVRTIDNLLALRNAMDGEIPKKIADRNLLVASRNIRNFGNIGKRIPESYFYLIKSNISAIMNLKLSSYILLMVSIVSAVGCGSEETAPIAGIIMMNGETFETPNVSTRKTTLSGPLGGSETTCLSLFELEPKDAFVAFDVCSSSEIYDTYEALLTFRRRFCDFRVEFTHSDAPNLMTNGDFMVEFERECDGQMIPFSVYISNPD